jgi:hypothetical protein
MSNNQTTTETKGEMSAINKFRAYKTKAIRRVSKAQGSAWAKQDAIDRIGQRWIEKNYPGMSI